MGDAPLNEKTAYLVKIGLGAIEKANDIKKAGIQTASGIQKFANWVDTSNDVGGKIQALSNAAGGMGEAVEKATRVRHYTNRKGLKGIEQKEALLQLHLTEARNLLAIRT